MCDKAVNNYPSTIEFVPECYKTQKMCDEAVNKCLFVFNCIPDQCKTQEMCGEAVDYSLAVLKLISDWFVTSKMIKNFLLLCMQIKIYTTLTKILAMPYLIGKEWVFLI